MADEKKEDEQEEQKGYAIELSPQVKMFLQTLNDEERQEVLDMFEKISKGEVQGEPVDDEDIPDDAREYMNNYRPPTKKDDPS